MKPNPEKVDCISLLVCDDVYRDEITKKLILVGAFSCINAVRLPCQHPRISVHFTLTNARGKYDLALYIENEKSGTRVVELRGPLEINDPLLISDTNVELRNIVFHESGKYWVTVEADGAILAQRPFWVQVQTEVKP
ncbi:MAG: hypothetical protein V1790_08745 [Planctomycetota bacterium]|jgi:hypothetical protein